MIDVIPLSMARELVRQVVVKELEKEHLPFKVIFGKEDASSEIDTFVRGAGLLGKVYVSPDLRVALISDISFTDKGVTIIKNADLVVGIDRQGVIVFRGDRDRSSSDRALWQLDIVQLLQSPLPSSSYPSASSSSNAIPPPPNPVAPSTPLFSFLISSLATQFGLSAPAPVEVFSARPSHSTSDVREARRLQQCVGVLKGIALTIEAGGISDVPAGLTPSLLRDVADRNDYIPQILSHRRRFIGGGSGVHSIRPGTEFSFDEIGKWAASTFGATFAILIVDRATGVTFPYAVNSKTALIDVLIIYCREMHSYGWKVERARCDSTSMIRADEFKAACAQLHIVVVPAPAEEQFKNPFERTWQVIQNDAAGLLLAQRNLTNLHWFLAICTACTLRACMINTASSLIDSQKAPWTILTGYKISYQHLTSSYFGALATVPRVGKSPGPLSSCNQLCVAICPVLNGTNAHVVLLQGEKIPRIRGGLVLIQEKTCRSPRARA